ncbi:hypothetical protein CTZ27_18910 [Streptomyces griseocarneus]|nr:hypothetical protein CTZ27_18910 [Streptomyces griseocarneus]
MRADEDGFEIAQRHGGWVVRLWWPTGPIMGGPQRMTVEPADDAEPRDVARGISTTVLRRLNLAAAAELTKNDPEMRRTLEEFSQVVDAHGEAAGRLLVEEGVSERYLAALAATYSAMAAAGASPVPWLARLIGRRPETIKDHLKKARRDGYLGTVAGKAGGGLTEKAKTILNSMQDARD